VWIVSEKLLALWNVSKDAFAKDENTTR